MTTAGRIARVLVDVGLPHLDRTFDYSIPEKFADSAAPGVRVRVRFAGRLVDGFILDIGDATTHEGRLSPLASVVSPEVVLVPDVLSACRAVAARYAASLSDVVRFAVPPRHARAEASADAFDDRDLAPPVAPGWNDYIGGEALLGRVGDGISAVRAVVGMMPARDPFIQLMQLAQAALTSGGGVLVVVPDAMDVQRCLAAAEATVGAGVATVLTADLGPQRRYRAFLDVLRGCTSLVIGTRAAAFAPVRNLRLMICWDDGDDLHSSPQAPYWHAREVLALRSHTSHVPLVLAGWSRTPEAQSLIASGWAKAVQPRKAALRLSAPRVSATGGDRERRDDPAATAARIPHLAWSTARSALEHGPVLVQVPHAGYARGLSCSRCREQIRCTSCAGPMQLPRAGQAASCRWCGATGEGTCRTCGGAAVRAGVIGSQRTVEELGRAFPGVPVVRSDAERVLARVDGRPEIVIATVGAEPVADGGYAAVLLLDGRSLLERPGLRSGEEAMRRWCNAAALARAGAPVVVTVDASVPVVQALTRWDPGWYAQRELDERAQLGLPPAVRMAALTGESAAVRDFVDRSTLPPATRVLGPVPVGRHDAPGLMRLLLSVDRRHGLSLAHALHSAASARSAHRAPGAVEVRVDPLDIG